MSRLPPGGQSQIDQEQYAENGSRAHPQSNQQREPDQQFNDAHCIPEEYGVRQYQPSQHWTIETDRAARDVVVEIILKPAMGEARPGDLVFAEQQKENRG